MTKHRTGKIKRKLIRDKQSKKAKKAGFGRRYERGTKRQANTIKKKMYERTRKFLGIKTKSERSVERTQTAAKPGPINSKEEKNIDIYMNRRAGKIKNRDQQLSIILYEIQSCKIFMDLIKDDSNISIETAILQLENADPFETTLAEFAKEKNRNAEGYIRQFRPFFDWAMRRYNKNDTNIFKNWLDINVPSVSPYDSEGSY